MAYKTIMDLAPSFLSDLIYQSVSLSHSAPTTWAFLLFFKHARHSSVSEPLALAVPSAWNPLPSRAAWLTHFRLLLKWHLFRALSLPPY